MSKLVTVLGNFSAKVDGIESRHADDVAPLQLDQEVSTIHLAAGAIRDTAA
jgi:hypothetical protein